MAAKEIENGGYKITTTIDQKIHSAMQNAVADYGYLLDDGTGRVEVGNVLMDKPNRCYSRLCRWSQLSKKIKNNHALILSAHQLPTTKPLLAYGIAIIDQGLMGRRNDSI